MTEKKGSRSSAVLLALLVILIGMVGMLFLLPENIDYDGYQEHRNNGDSLYRLGMYQEATNQYQQALDYKPNDRYAHAQIKDAGQFTEFTSYQKNFGGKEYDMGKDLIETPDGGIIVVGSTRSYSKGEEDIWIIRIDRFGHLEWRRNYGGSAKDEGFKVIAADDGGYIILGSTYSFGAGNGDAWLLKINEKGRKIWDRIIGAEGLDIALDIAKGIDKDYILAGFTESSGEGEADLWMVKTNERGEVIWQQTFGGEQWDGATSVVANADSSYTFSGYHQSFSLGGVTDGMTICMDANGEELWKRNHGGDKSEIITNMIQSKDGGYLCVGSSDTHSQGEQDVWVFKINEEGKEIWQKMIGGKVRDIGKKAILLANGDYIIAGETASYGKGDKDAWLLKMSSSGKLLWRKEFGDAQAQVANGVIATSDGGLAFAGYTTSKEGNTDVWVVKMDKEGNIK